MEGAKMSLSFLVNAAEQQQQKELLKNKRPATMPAAYQPTPKRARTTSGQSRSSKKGSGSGVRITAASKADLHAQMMRYGPVLFEKDDEGRYCCFFDGCDQKMANNFSRHIVGHEMRGDAVKNHLRKPAVSKLLCFIDQTPQTCAAVQAAHLTGVQQQPSPRSSSPVSSPCSSASSSPVSSPNTSPMSSPGLSSSPFHLPNPSQQGPGLMTLLCALDARDTLDKLGLGMCSRDALLVALGQLSATKKEQAATSM